MSQLGAIKLGTADSLPIGNGGQNQSISSAIDLNALADDKKIFTKGKLKALFTKQAMTSLTLGGATSILAKSAALAFFGTTGASVVVSAVAAAAFAGAISGVVKYGLDRHFAKKRGEEFDAFFTIKTWKKIGLQAGIGALGGTAFQGIDHLLGGQVSAVIAKAIAPAAPYVHQALNTVAEIVAPVAPIAAKVGGFFSKIAASVAGALGISSSAPAPVPAPAPVAAFVPPVSIEPVVAAPVELQQSSFDVPELPAAPALENALPQIDAVQTEVSAADFTAKMPELPLPADTALPEFTAPAPEAVVSNVTEVTPPRLEDAVPAPVAESAQVILPTPSPLERAAELIKGQKNVSPYIQQRLAAALEGNAQALKDIGHALYNAQGLPGNKQLAVELFRQSAEGGNIQGKVAYAYATSAPAPVATQVAPVAPRPVAVAVQQPAVYTPPPVAPVPAPVVSVPDAVVPKPSAVPTKTIAVNGTSARVAMDCVTKIGVNSAEVDCTVNVIKGKLPFAIGDSFRTTNPGIRLQTP